MTDTKLKNTTDTNDLKELIKPKHKEVVKDIRAGNTEGLEHIFNSPGSLRCEDESLNFNYFHMAAIYGNEQTFHVLRGNCDPKLLQSTDAYNLKPIDYAYMLNSSIPMSYFGGSVPLSTPSPSSVIFCEHKAEIARMGVALGVTLGVTLGVKLDVSMEALYTSIGVGTIFFLFAREAAESYIDYGNKYYDEQFKCEDYQRYSSIDISTMQPDSPGQFLKYAQIHNKTYVVQSDHCTDGDKLVAQQSFQIFKDTTDEAFTLSVCGRISANDEAYTELSHYSN